MKALDLFAGTGWGVACQRLGIDEEGVEIMPEAVATREANGMKTLFRDVWDGLLGRVVVPGYLILIASPPCQTFSMAGHGAGRKALDEVLEAIELHAYKSPEQLIEFGEKHDPRTALVLAPLAYIWRDRPQYVALEQVPTVLPVWEAYAEVMREWGYSVKTEVLNAEQYGVPQTRRRAILVARLDGPVSLPKPTHSKYHSHDPERIDPGVKRWVSMAEALGWGHETPSPTVTGDPRIAPRGCKHPQPGCCTQYPGTPGKQFPEGTVNLSVDDASALQTYAVRFTQNNKLAHQARRTLDHPAPTITAGHDSGNRGFLDADDNLTIATPEQVAALQSYPSGRGLTNRPSPTITGGGTETGGAEPIAKYHARYTNDPAWIGSTERLSTDECAALQTYPSEPFVWCGSKTKQFLQIGNAVPPMLAEAILTALIAPTKTAAPRRARRKLL